MLDLGPPSPDHLLTDFGAPDGYRDLVRGEYLFRRGDRCWGVFALELGRMRLVRTTDAGRELTLDHVFAGRSFAEASLFSEHYHCDCRAELASRVAVYDGEAARAMLRDDPERALAWARRLAGQVRDQRALLEVRSIVSARERLLAYLSLRADTDATLPVPSLRAVAAEIGLAEETVYRTVARLESEGSLERTAGIVRLL